MPPLQSTQRLWTFISGLLWGLSGGVGVMAWVLLKLLRFQAGELERRNAWTRLRHKREGGARPQLPATARWEDLDPDCRELLRGVDDSLSSRGAPRMDEDELHVAVEVIWGERDEGGPRWAIQQAVTEVLRRRREAPTS